MLIIASQHKCVVHAHAVCCIAIGKCVVFVQYGEYSFFPQTSKSVQFVQLNNKKYLDTYSRECERDSMVHDALILLLQNVFNRHNGHSSILL